MAGEIVNDLEGKKYVCEHCQTHLACSEDVVKFFYYKLGMPYVIDKVVNVIVGKKEERSTLTGIHTMADIFCVGCCANVGYKYEDTKEKQKFRVGKFVLKRYQVLGPDGSNCLITQGMRHLQL